MKKLLIMAMALLTIGLFSCKKDGSIANNAASMSPKAVLSGGYLSQDVMTVPVVWNVGSFVFNKEDMTSQFAGYNFVFIDPIVIVTTKTNTYYGKWSVLSSKQLLLDFQAPPSSGNGDFDIKAPDRFILNAMNEEWNIREMNLNSIVLEIKTENYSKELSFYIAN